MSEQNLEIPKDMNWELYKLYNQDLAGMSEEQLIAHYDNHGRYEKRRYLHELPEGFDANCYRLKNDDIGHLSDQELMKHYTMHGKNEQRSYLAEHEPNKIVRRKRQIIKTKGATQINL